MRRLVTIASALALLITVGATSAHAEAPAAKPSTAPVTAPAFGIPDAFGLMLAVFSFLDGGNEAALAEINSKVTELSKTVVNGFNQLEIDIANSRYASAQEELRPVTTATNRAFKDLQTLQNEKLTAAERKTATTRFKKNCAAVTTEPNELLQMYSGDPQDALSQSGLLPAAWSVIVAGERAQQSVAAGKTPAFYPYSTVNLMRHVGDLAELRITQYALVVGTCQALTESDEAAGQSAATAVHDLILKGDSDAAGLEAIEASLPKTLPKLTGVFTGEIADGKGLVVGNFSTYQEPTDEKKSITNMATGLTLGSVPGNDPHYGASAVYVGINPKELEVKNNSYRTTDGLRREVCITTGDRYLWNLCNGNARQGLAFKDGNIKFTQQSDIRFCIGVDNPYGYTLWSHNLYGSQITYPPSLNGALELLRTERCSDDPFQQWFENGPVPTSNVNVAAKLSGAKVNGSPKGANPDGEQHPWSTDWQYFQATWLNNMRTAIVNSGTTMRKVTHTYGSPRTPADRRILPALQQAPMLNPMAATTWVADGPSWNVYGEPTAKGERRTLVKVAGEDRVAGVYVGNTTAATTLFGVPVEGCAYTYERPIDEPFACVTKRG